MEMKDIICQHPECIYPSHNKNLRGSWAIVNLTKYIIIYAKGYIFGVVQIQCLCCTKILKEKNSYFLDFSKKWSLLNSFFRKKKGKREREILLLFQS